MGCRKVAPQTALVRLALVDGRIVIDRHAAGRGAWLCAGSHGCLQLAVRRKAFDRVWRNSAPKVLDPDIASVFEADGPDVTD